MKKNFTYLLLATLVFFATNSLAQKTKECVIKYNLYKGDYKTKKYAVAKTHLPELIEKCPTLSVNVYKYGFKIGTKTGDHTLVKQMYDLRLKYYPNKDVAKVHDDYAKYLIKSKKGTDAEIFALLEKAYKADPVRMSVTNIFRYFKGVTAKNKNTNPQMVFDTYDDVMESVEEKLADYTKKIAKIDTTNMDKKTAKNLRAYNINSKALGQVEGGLDKIISEIATCDRLVPLYKRDIDANRTNAVWLRRAVSRMYKKGCQSDPLFAELARAYAEASPSADAYSFLAGVLDKNGKEAEAIEMRKKAFELETDPLKKANFKLKFAQNAREKGQFAKARQLAREAIQFNPNFGKAYLFIAGLYAKSANKCGKNEFEKRMVYVAALNKARRASAVDPSISSSARRYIRSYNLNVPSKKVIFTAGVTPGGSYTIKCWIGETVRIPQI